MAFRPHGVMSSWTRACALKALAALSPDEVDDVLVASLFHPEPMLQEVAAASILGVDSEAYTRHTGRLPTEARERLSRVLSPGRPEGSAWMRRSMFGRLAALREVRGFSTLPWQSLIAIAAEAEEIEIETGEVFPPSGEPEGKLYVVVEGRLGSYTEAGGMGVVGPGMLLAFAEMMPPCRVLDAGRAYRLNGDRICELTVAHGDLVPALLDAASPQAIQQVLSLSRSFESAISFAPSH